MLAVGFPVCYVERHNTTLFHPLYRPIPHVASHIQLHWVGTYLGM